MNRLIAFDNINFPACSGGKAYRLFQLFHQNINVPFGGIVPFSFYTEFLKENKELDNFLNENGEEDKNADIILEAFTKASLPKELETEVLAFYELLLEKGYKHVVVRSSGNIEDGYSTSFAGQFESYLNIDNREKLLQSIKKCWASKYSKKVINYCQANSIPIEEIKMSVIVQGQVNSELSGVVFTANPLSGNDKEIVIEADKGLGDSLVQGTINPERYIYNWFTQKTKRFDDNSKEYKELSANKEFVKHILKEKQVKELAEICLEIQQYYGEPLDIEWAFEKELFYIVQARPLTTIHFDVADEWTNADLKDGGISSSIATPMMYSLYEYIFENTMPDYFKNIKAPNKRKNIKWFNWWFGYAYWNMKAAKECVKKVPGFIERNFDRSIGIEPDYEGNGHVTAYTPVSIFNGLKILFATKISIAKRPGKCKRIINSVKTLFADIESHDFDSMSIAELTTYTERLINKHYLMLEGGYFYTIYDNSNAATFCQEAIEKYNKKNIEHKADYIKLIGGLKNLSHLKPTVELWQLSRKILDDRNACDFFKNLSAQQLSDFYNSVEAFPYSIELQAFINNHKYHSKRELDIQVPNWQEDPMQIFEILLEFVNNSTAPDPRKANQKQFEVFLEEKDKLKSKKLVRKIKTHRHLLWWREEMRDYSTKMYYYIRQCLLKLAEKLVNDGVIKNHDDIFFLRFNEVFSLAKGNEADSYIKLIEKNKILFRSYRNFNKPNEIWQRQNYKLKTNKYWFKKQTELIGIPGSFGIIKAKARVISSVNEVNALCEGEILVTKFTDPAWTPYFARISGLVTETGGMLSHGAVVSREYGIPAVLGVNNATSIIKTNDIIEVNGLSGKITIIKNNNG